MVKYTVRFEDEVYIFRSKMSQSMADLAFRMWQLFDYQEDTCYYLDNMVVVNMEVEYI